MPAGTVNGGHTVAQAPVQVVFPVPSGEYRYRVLPDWSTRIVPREPCGTVDTETTAALDEVTPVPTLVVVGDEAPVELQAAATTTTATSAAPTSQRDPRTGPTGDWLVRPPSLDLTLGSTGHTSFPVDCPVLRPAERFRSAVGRSSQLTTDHEGSTPKGGSGLHQIGPVFRMVEQPL